MSLGGGPPGRGLIPGGGGGRMPGGGGPSFGLIPGGGGPPSGLIPGGGGGLSPAGIMSAGGGGLLSPGFRRSMGAASAFGLSGSGRSCLIPGPGLLAGAICLSAC